MLLARFTNRLYGNGVLVLTPAEYVIVSTHFLHFSGFRRFEVSGFLGFGPTAFQPWHRCSMQGLCFLLKHPQHHHHHGRPHHHEHLYHRQQSIMNVILTSS